MSQQVQHRRSSSVATVRCKLILGLCAVFALALGGFAYAEEVPLVPVKDATLTHPRVGVDHAARNFGVWDDPEASGDLHFETPPGYQGAVYTECTILGFVFYHPQHVVRLPNKNNYAYFMVSQSNGGGNDTPKGAIFVCKSALPVDANDRVQNSSTGYDGRIIWERIFTGSTTGYNHPGKMQVIGNLLLVSMENWIGDYTTTCTYGQGSAADAVYFYDVRDPDNPRYWGSLNTDDLGHGITTVNDVAMIDNGDFWILSVSGHWWRADEVSPNMSAWTYGGMGSGPGLSEAHGGIFYSYEEYQAPLTAPTTYSGDLIPSQGQKRFMYFDGNGETEEFKFDTVVFGPDPSSPYSFRAPLVAPPATVDVRKADELRCYTSAPNAWGGEKDYDAAGVYVTGGVPIIYAPQIGYQAVRIKQIYHPSNAYLTMAQATSSNGMKWATGGDGDWFAQLDPPRAKTSKILDNQSTFLETTVTGIGVLAFDWTVSSEAGYDYLRFELDGVQQPGAPRISGQVGWSRMTVNVPALGSHTLRWTYQKDSSLLGGSDAAGLRHVTFLSTSGFVDVASGGPLGDSGSGVGVAWGDYDNDGDLDLYLANFGSPNKLFRNDGGGTFVDATGGLPLGDSGSGRGVAWGDYDGDGDLDLYLANLLSANRLYRNDGGGTFVDVAAGTPLADSGNGIGVAWGDYDGDGDLDLYLANGGSANKLFRNDSGTFADATSGPLGDTGSGYGVAWGDYDNDGDLDLYLANDGSANKLFRNDGGGTFVDATGGLPLGDTGDGVGVAWGDYDNDGDLDLYLANNNQANKLFRNDGGGTFVDVTGGLPLGDSGSGRGVAWGDYDNDGDLDLYLANEGSANKLLRNDAAAGQHWLRVKLQGTSSNTSGIGARVRVVSGELRQIREISGGSGSYSQNEMVASFGLGSAATVDSLIVHWPSGIVQVVDPAPAVDQSLQVVEDADFQDIAAGTSLGDAGGEGSGVAWGDYDSDGDLDLYVANYNTANKLFRNDGGGTFVDVAAGTPLGDSGGGEGVAWGDYDNDGDLDLYLANNGQANKLFRNDGDSSFADATGGLPLGDTGPGAGVAWGDYDNDGDLDLYLAKVASANRLLRNDGGGTFVDVAAGTPLGDTGDGAGMAWGDYDNDGDLDLYLANVNSANKLFRNDGGDSFVDVAAGTPRGDEGAGVGVAWGDYDGDGDLDLYLANYVSANKLFRNEGGRQHWLQVKLEGTESNRAGIGARVTVAAGGVSQIREISGGSGYLSQDAMVASFGLGGTTTVDSLIVRWPSGTVQVVDPVPSVDSAITVLEQNSPAFVDATNGSPLADAAYGGGVAWGDYDDDGDLDLYLANYGSANKLLRNDGGTFVDATSGPLGDTANGRGVAWGDYDNDGDLDLYLTNLLEANKLFRNDGGGTFVDATTGPLGDAGGGQAGTWGDYDNDGDLDLYLVNAFGAANRLFHNDGGGTFTDATTGPLGNAGNGRGAAWGDYDDDGDLDLYVANYGSANKLLRNDGGGAFTDATSGPLGDPGTSQGVAWGDFDNDGDLDLYVANYGTANKLLRNDGGGVFTDATSGPLGDTGQGTAVAWGDYDNDGDLDLYLGNNGANRLFRNEGGGTFTDATVGSLGDIGNGQGVAWGDYDMDGALDFYLGNNGQANKLFHNEAAAGQHWLQVKLQGRTSNRAGIGARVTVVAGGVSQIREISGGSGYLSQDAMVASFGLGATTTVDSLIVRWPSGIVQVVDPVPSPDQQLLVVEPSSPTAVDPAGDRIPVAYRLHEAVPNPFNPSTTIRFDLPQPGTVELTIYDVAGRRVRTLVQETRAAGRHDVVWRGLDESGRSVASGVYLYKLQAGSYVETRRMTLLK